MRPSFAWADRAVRTVLVVEPDDESVALITGALAGRFRTVPAGSGADALAQVERLQPDLVVISFALPDMDALELCRRVVARPSSPVVLMSGADPESEVLPTYTAGADGYLAQPFRLREVEARINAALRRLPPAANAADGRLVGGDVAVDLERHEVMVRGHLVRLPLREFELLALLIASPGRVWTREALVRRVWGETPASGTKSVDVHVGRIRARIEEDPSTPTRILTVRGVGYRYVAWQAAASPPMLTVPPGGF